MRYRVCTNAEQERLIKESERSMMMQSNQRSSGAGAQLAE